MSTVTRYTLRPLGPADRAVVTPILVREWGATEVLALSLGEPVDASALPGWLAERDGEVVGLLTYLADGDVVELVTINAFAGGGVGAALLAELTAHCRATGGPGHPRDHHERQHPGAALLPASGLPADRAARRRGRRGEET